MTDQELLKAIQSDDTEQIMLDMLRSELDAEFEKPDSELDVDKINRITAIMDIITGSEQITAEKTQQGIQKLKQVMRQQKPRKAIRRLGWVAACACTVLVLSNIWSYSAYGISVFSAAYQMINGGITIDFQKEDSASSVGNPYEEDMRKICLEHDFGGDVLIPTYIPAGFEPAENYGQYRNEEADRIIFFFFTNKSIKLNITVRQFFSEEDSIPISIPSSEYNISPQVIGNTTVHISKETEDQQYWALFQIGLTQYTVFADGLDYVECQKFLESMLNNIQ